MPVRLRELALGAALACLCLSAPASQCDPEEGLEARLLRHEGIRECPYSDSLGHWTIGVGHLIRGQVDPDECWSRAHIMEILYDDIDRAQAGAHRLVDHWYAHTAMRRDVLTELAFQLGVHGLGTFRRMLAALEEGYFARAADELLDSALSAQSPARAAELACLLRGPPYERMTASGA